MESQDQLWGSPFNNKIDKNSCVAPLIDSSLLRTLHSATAASERSDVQRVGFAVGRAFERWAPHPAAPRRSIAACPVNDLHAALQNVWGQLEACGRDP